MKKSYNGFSIPRAFIFLFILFAIIFLLYKAFDDSRMNTEIDSANKKANVVYEAAEEWLSLNKSTILEYKNYDKDEIVFVSSKTDNKKAQANVNNKTIYMDMEGYFDEFFSGNWIVVINKNDLTVEYALWSYDTLTENDAENLNTRDKQKDKYKNNNMIIGYYSK